MLRLVAVCAVPRFFRFFLPVWDAIAARGHETHIVCGGDWTSDALGDGAKRHQVHHVDLARNIAPGLDLLCLAQLTRLLHRIRPHIVHGHGPKAGLLSMLAATATRVPGRLYTIHGLRHETLREPMQSGLRKLETLSIRLAHRALCVSPSVMSRAVADLGVRPDDLSMLLQGSVAGVDAAGAFRPDVHRQGARDLRERLGLLPGHRLVGFVGRLARDKGIAELTEAWTRIARERSDMHLVLVGELDVTDPVSIDELVSLPRVHQLGFQMDVPPTYAALDLLLLPTYREGFPQVLLEAAAMEIPAIATRVTGCVDAIVDGETGVLVPVHDSESLARMTLQLLDDPELCAQMGAAARRRVLRDFQVAPLAQATLDLYQELTASPR